MITDYDPTKDPDEREWARTPEGYRVVFVEKYHRQAGIRLPNLILHSGIHAVVENQIAEGESLPTKPTLKRLMAEGLDRHDAIHAIGGVMMKYMKEMRISNIKHHSVKAYAKKLDEITAANYLRKFDEGEDRNDIPDID